MEAGFFYFIDKNIVFANVELIKKVMRKYN